MELIQGLFTLNIFDFATKAKTLHIKGIVVINCPFLNELVINSLKSISFTKTGLFLCMVIYPNQVPKFFRKLKGFSSMYKLFILSNI